MTLGTFHPIPANGVTLNVAQAGNPNGELVLLLHGFPEFSYEWREQVPALAQADYWVWTPDQRGYNLSEKPSEVAAYHIDELAKDVIGLIDAAGREQCYLIAHDWGAAVAWWVAMKYPDRIKKLIILNVPHPVIMEKMVYQERFWQQFVKSWYILFFQLPWLPERAMLSGMGEWFMRYNSVNAFTDEEMLNYRAAWRQPNAMTSMINWYRATFIRKPKPAKPKSTTSPRKLEIIPPTLILWGKKDAYLHWKTAERSLEICRDGRIVYLEDASHWLLHEQPERINQLILDFLKD